ncbi:TonB-dependent receptor plug domain-containing protein [Luteimonas suaedae]|uniref:TonB-dependent receptor plug domain-containing protein n=1 Tax=Luteimonas suaedae TaxID=2605430 RepID=UPI0011EF3240|nr:TonB-dependent receptor [Luteimonas suaedae]
MKYNALAAAALLALFPLAPNSARAQSASAPADDVTSLDAMVVTGSRGSSRTQFDTLVPVDVFSAEEIQAVESTDLNDVLAQLVPSFVVQRLPMADGLVFVRPASLRGLSPDHALVLVNGRRFHRTALLGSRGAQAPDLSQIPTAAIERIEVLRDGASAQYGSDAIAGVINIILSDDSGTELTAQLSEYAEGDGFAQQYGARHGIALGDYGHLSMFAEIARSDATSRTRQRADAIAFQQDHPELDVPDPVQRWGQPDLESVRGGFDARVPLTQTVALYGYALLGTSEGFSDFNWRNPDGTASVYSDTDVFPDWNASEIYPVGFSPRYGMEQEDLQTVVGLSGEFNPDFTWDVSASYGSNDIDFFLDNSINASLGPESPTGFWLGRLSQDELDFNADFVYAWAVDALPLPVNIAFGAEHRTETYGITAGDPASYAVGPGAVAGLAPNANGAPGFSTQQAGEWDQTSSAAYLDVEVPLTERWNVGAAARYEDYSEFGNSLDGKLSSRFEFNDHVALRGSISSGFRAPTPGQLYATSTTQGLDTNTLQVFTSGRLSPSDPIARMLGATPLTPEESRSVTAGLAWQSGNGFSGSIDLYDIEVTDRFSTSQSFQIPDGVPNPNQYTSVSFFTNDFDTTTRGIDIVATWRGSLGPGRLGTTLAWNYNKTEVDGGDTGVASNETQRVIFERRIPRQKATWTHTWEQGDWSLLGRVRHYGSWTDSSGNADGDIFQRFGAETLLDLAVSWRATEMLTLRAGADNVLDSYPDEATFQASRGLIYSRNAPYDTDGRNVYAQLRVAF